MQTTMDSNATGLINTQEGYMSCHKSCKGETKGRLQLRLRGGQAVQTTMDSDAAGLVNTQEG